MHTLGITDGGGRGLGAAMSARPTNSALSDFLAGRAREEEGHRRRALERAWRVAMFSWTEEAADLANEGRPLTELQGIGPWLAGIIEEWLGRAGRDVDDAPPPDPLRQGFLSRAEIDAAASSRPDLREALRGDLQSHSTYTDGKDRVADMAQAAADLGLSYLAVTDHSKTLPIAGGMDEAGFARQAEEIEDVRHDPALRSRGFRLLHGIEMNVSPEGFGDMDPDFLRTLDIVLGTFHSKLRVAEDQTDRYLAAIRNGGMDVFAHPRCRMFGRRPGLTADWSRVFAEAVARGVALEVDCHPSRQDLNVELLRQAADQGAWISVGTDAHSRIELQHIDIGVATVALAGIPTDRILNLLPPDELVERIRNRRASR
jgi:histidinol phosphatase-like PHP family hydrolase